MATAAAPTTMGTAAPPTNSPRRRSVAVKRSVDDSDSDSGAATLAKRTKNGDGSSIGPNDVASLSWSLEDLGHLVANLASCLPPNDLIKYNTMVEKLDWEKVRFGSYSAADCKDKWTQVMQKLRRYRTLTDLVIDARDWLKQPWPAGNSTAAGSRRPKHPDLPKKPMTPYFRFYHEKREKYSRENPDLSMTELAKLISKKFQELSDKKKQKYKEGYDKDNEVYKAEMSKFKKAHPEVFADPPHKHPQAANSSPCPPDAVPEKPQTPVQLFTLDRLKKPDFSRLDKKEAHDVIRKQWAALSDGKRLKWIRRSLQDQQRYEMEVAEYSQAYPGFKAASVKPILSKAEQEFKDKCDGKPERPPNSGYSLFSRIMLRQLKNVPAKEKMAEISRLWKALGQGERDSYNKQATRANAKYKEKYAAYLSNLPEEERHKLEADGTSAKSGGTAAGAVASKKGAASGRAAGDENQPPPGGQQTQQERPKPKKPLSAMFFFQQEKVSGMKERCPQLSHQEVMRALAREFSELSDRKKEKYQKMATEARQRAIEETNGHKVKEERTYQSAAQPTSNRKNRLFKGEPKKPPQSGYGVFSTEMLSQLVDVDPKHRMAEIAKRWNVMSDAEKETYKRKVQDQQRKYAKELSRFLENLTPEERLEYEARRAKMKDKRKGGAIKAAATRKEKKRNAANNAKPKEQRAPSSGSSSDDSSDEDEDDEEEEEDEEEEAKNSDKSEEASDSSSEADSDSGSSDSSSSDEEEEENAAVPKKPPVVRKEPPLPVPKVEANNTGHQEEEEEESSDSDNEESSSDSSDDDSNESGSDSKD